MKSAGRAIGGSIVALAVAAAALVACLRPSPASVLASDATWRAADGPRELRNGLVVPAGVTLTLEAGASVLVGKGAAVTVAGTLVARGDAATPVRFGALDDHEGWAGIVAAHGGSVVLSRVRLVAAGTRRACIDADDARIVADHLQLEAPRGSAIRALHSTVDVADTDFPGVGDHEVIHGYRLSTSRVLSIKRCTFQPVHGFHDIVDFADCEPGGVVGTVEDSTFTGGSDDGIDTDTCRMTVERCTFRKFHQEGHSHDSSGLSAGTEARVDVRDCTFTDCDYGVTLADSALATLERCTIGRSRFAAVSLAERDSGGGEVRLIGCSLCANAATFANRERALRVEVVATSESASCPDGSP